MKNKRTVELELELTADKEMLDELREELAKARLAAVNFADDVEYLVETMAEKTRELNKLRELEAQYELS